jgi:glucose/mannose-6-phosphate isomerase
MGLLEEFQLQAFDSENVFEKLKRSSDQWFEAIEITRNLTFSFKKDDIENVVITGMGGAAIAGDMIKSLTVDSAHIPVIMNRSYSLPSFVNDKTLVIILSYSGDTEETVSAANHALERNAHCVGISSGGYIASLATSDRFDLIKITPDLSSRSALAYFLIGIWRTFQNLDIFAEGDDLLIETGHFIAEQIAIFSNLEENEPAELAEEILDSLPVIYSSDGILKPINLRWRNQIQEYAKTLAYGGILPEMNHNEIVGWERTSHLMGRVSCIQLIDENDHYRVQRRMDISAELIEPHAVAYQRVRAVGPCPLRRMIYMVLFGDFMAYYLAILSETDPAPITKIDLLKTKLKEME